MSGPIPAGSPELTTIKGVLLPKEVPVLRIRFAEGNARMLWLRHEPKP
jgi:hypothetical protein